MLNRIYIQICLLVPVLVGSCLSPNPDHVSSPDAELASLLGDLRSVRDGNFKVSTQRGSDAAEKSRHAAKVEGEIAGELRELGFLYPGHVPSLVANAALAYERSDSVGAQKYLDQALSCDPANIPAILLRVRIASEGGNLPYARRKLREQLEILPEVAELRQAYSGVLFLMGEYGEAGAELDMVDRLKGVTNGTWQTNYHRGLIAEAEGELDLAHAFFRRSIEQEPSFLPAARRARWLDSRRSNSLLP